MVQSKGTRPDSHLLRMDFTGSRKYSGRSCDVRRVGAAGEIEARRAMPTSGAARSGAAPGTASVAALAATKTASFRKPCALRRASPQEAGIGGRRASRAAIWNTVRNDAARPVERGTLAGPCVRAMIRANRKERSRGEWSAAADRKTHRFG